MSQATWRLLALALGAVSGCVGSDAVAEYVG